MNSKHKSENEEGMVEYFDQKYMKYYMNLARPNFNSNVLTSFYEKGHLFYEKKSNFKAQSESIIPINETNFDSEKVTQSASTQTIEKCENHEMENVLKMIKKLKTLVLDDFGVKVSNLKKIVLGVSFKHLVSYLNRNGLKLYFENSLNFNFVSFVFKKFYKIYSVKIFSLIFFIICFVLIKTNLVVKMFGENYFTILVKQLLDEIISFKEPDIYEF
jgi:hypothetical protein